MLRRVRGAALGALFKIPLALYVFGALCSAEGQEGCTITAGLCRNFPEYQRSQFRDNVGEEHGGVGSSDAACLKRAQDFHYWCGNTDADGAQVAATFNPASVTQVYHPGACEPGWSQWDAFCYKHYWEHKNWFEAEQLCRQRDAHLASIHSRAENRFIFTLTSGLSAWIGYTDLDQDTHYQWSDSTQDDFTNFAKNCTGREMDEDCKPEERKQQWYDWEGGDKGTFVCKRNARLPVALLTNISKQELVQKPWASLLPALGPLAGKGGVAAQGAAAATPLPELKVDDLIVGKTHPTTPAAKVEPRFAAPAGSFI